MKKTLIFIALLILMVSFSTAQVSQADMTHVWECDGNLLDSTSNFTLIGQGGANTQTVTKHLGTGACDTSMSDNSYFETNFFDYDTAHALEFWVYRYGWSATSWAVLLSTNDTDAGASNIDYGWYGTSGPVSYYKNSYEVGSAYLIPATTWTHYILSWDESNMYFYENGTLFHTDPNAPLKDKSVIFGSWDNAGKGRGYNGLYDSIKIFNRNLTQADVTELYNNGTGKTYANYATSQSSFLISAKDNYGNSINTFSATINSVTYNTTTGTLNTTYINNASNFYNISITTNNYFNKTLLNVNSSNDLIVNLTQSEIRFNISERVTNNTFYNYTVNDSLITDTTTTNTAVLNLLNGSNTISLINDLGYYNYTNTFNVSPLDNKTINLTVYNHKITFNAFNNFTSDAINNFTITFNTTNYIETVSTTTGSIVFNVTNGLVYNANINADNFVIDDVYNLSLTGVSSSQTFYLWEILSVYLNFYDEITEALMNTTINVRFINAEGAINYSTTNGSLYAQNLNTGEYRIEFSSIGYPERLYYIILTSASSEQLQLFLLNTGNATQTDIKVLDQVSDVVTNTYVKLLRYYLSCNCYKTVEIGKTNFDGETFVQAQQVEEFYKVIIADSDETYLTTDPFKITTSLLTFFINLGVVDPTEDFDDLQNVYESLTFNNDTNNFKYTWSDNNNNVLKGCLKVYKILVSSETLFNSTCVSSTASTLLIGVTNDNSSTYKGVSSLYLDSETETIRDILFKSFGVGKAVFGEIGVFLSIFLLIIITLIGIWNPNVAIIFLIVGLILVTGFGILTIPITALMAIIGVGIIIILLNRA